MPAVGGAVGGLRSTPICKSHTPYSRLEAAYHRADKAIQNIVELLAAA